MTRDGKDAFVKLCEDFLERGQVLSSEEIKEQQLIIASLSKELLQAVRLLHSSRRRSHELGDLEGARESEYDKLISLRGVKALEVGGSVITITTDPVILEHEGRRFLIGEFAIDLDLEGSISIRNLNNTLRKGGWEHPHVQGGMPCLGNVRDGMLKLLGEIELVPLASMLLQFLESYDPESAYCPIDMWQEV